ncbi:MAG: DUF4129 domain-containing protein [Vicinamibacteria bacterium]
MSDARALSIAPYTARRAGSGDGPDAAALFLPLRGLALYVLSAGSVLTAQIAWDPATRGSAVRLGVAALVLALATLGGESLADAFPALRGRDAFRARVWLLAGYVALATLAIVGAVGAPIPLLLEKQVTLFSALQALFLLVPALAPGSLATLSNALLLTLLASLRGGPLAGLAVGCFLAATASFMLFDHFARRLASRSAADPGRLLAHALREGGRLVLPPVLCLLAFHALVPAAPHVALASGLFEQADQDRLVAAYMQLATASLLGAASVYYASRLLRRRPSKVVALPEELPVERGSEEILPERPRRGRPRYEGARGRVIRAYVTLLEERGAAEAVRRPGATPTELLPRLGEPRDAAARLTALFQAARYGPGEPLAAQVAAAEQDLSALRRARERAPSR